MSTIPASLYVTVLPGVLAAGGTALVLNGVMLTNSTRLPIGTVASFPSAYNVGAFFGFTSKEYTEATRYFLGFDTSTKKPTALLMAQYPSAAVPAWLRSGPINSIPLQTLQGFNQSLTVLFDGVPRTATVNLAGATSYTAAAALIGSALNATQVSDSTFTGSVALQNASFVASISGNTMSVSTVTSGSLAAGAAVAGAAAGTQVTSQVSGATGGPGVYEVSVAQGLTASVLTATYGLLTVTAVTSGTLSTGQTLFGTGVTSGTQVTGYGTGTGLLGTYVVSPSQTIASGTLQTIATPITATFDSVSGCLVLYSGDVGAVASSGFASGPLATSLSMTAATGATLSQGADGAQPGPFMSALTNVTQNWCIFMHMFDPDGGNGNAQKLAFAQWTNAQNRRYLYVPKDTDPAPAASSSAPTSLGALVGGPNGLAGVGPVWEPPGSSGLGHAAFALSIPASTDFSARNGRATFAYKGQTGLTAAVTDLQTATNLIANGYNYYGASGTANQTFQFLYPGQASGPFLWLDSYVDEIWLNNALQQALMSLLTTAKSIPFNMEGYGLVIAACQDPINAALYFGAIRTGVTLSAQQKALINNAAGQVIDPLVTQQGYYLQVIDAAPQVRAARGPLAVNLWYADGQSVHTINLNSIAVL